MTPYLSHLSKLTNCDINRGRQFYSFYRSHEPIVKIKKTDLDHFEKLGCYPEIILILAFNEYLEWPQES